MTAPSPTTTAIATALIAALAALAKKFLPARKALKPEYISRAEFHDGLEKVRDRIGASYLALADKIELQHNQVLTKLDCQGTNFEHRLDALEASMARLDERTATCQTNQTIWKHN